MIAMNTKRINYQEKGYIFLWLKQLFFFFKLFLLEKDFPKLFLLETIRLGLKSAAFLWIPNGEGADG